MHNSYPHIAESLRYKDIMDLIRNAVIYPDRKMVEQWCNIVQVNKVTSMYLFIYAFNGTLMH